MTTPEQRPTISIFGCGGCGIEILKDFMGAGLKPYDEEINYITVDTSQSNDRGIPEATLNFRLSDIGSGGVRQAHYDQIKKDLGTHKLSEHASDINVVCFSLGGGSGSVIGPLLAQLFGRNGKAVVLVNVADNGSRLICDNNIATIKTLEKFAKDNKADFPTLLFSNMETGMIKVNKGIVEKLDRFVRMLTDHSVSRLDWADRVNLLRPSSIGCGVNGYYLMDVSESCSDGTEPKGHVGIHLEAGDAVYSMMCINDEGSTEPIVSGIGYVGVSDELRSVCLVGAPIPTSVTKALRDSTITQRRTTVKPTEISSAFDDLDDEASDVIF